MNLVSSRTLQRPGRTQSNFGTNDENSTSRIIIPSIAEPSIFKYIFFLFYCFLALKLFSKHQPKSNRSLIMNALQYRIFPGAVSAEKKNKVI